MFLTPLYRSSVITRLLTPTCQPSQLTLSSLELHLHHFQNMVTILLNEFFGKSIPSVRGVKPAYCLASREVVNGARGE